jgi:hypothetical protein
MCCFGEEGLDSALPPRAAFDLLRWLLLVLLRHAHFQGVLRPGEAAIAEAAREGWRATQALDGRARRVWQHNLSRQL